MSLSATDGVLFLECVALAVHVEIEVLPVEVQKLFEGAEKRSVEVALLFVEE